MFTSEKDPYYSLFTTKYTNFYGKTFGLLAIKEAGGLTPVHLIHESMMCSKDRLTSSGKI